MCKGEDSDYMSIFSFYKGFINILGFNTNEEKYSCNYDDKESLKKDWENVGRDIWSAIAEYEQYTKQN